MLSGWPKNEQTFTIPPCEMFRNGPPQMTKKDRFSRLFELNGRLLCAVEHSSTEQLLVSKFGWYYFMKLANFWFCFLSITLIVFLCIQLKKCYNIMVIFFLQISSSYSCGAIALTIVFYLKYCSIFFFVNCSFSFEWIPFTLSMLTWLLWKVDKFKFMNMHLHIFWFLFQILSTLSCWELELTKSWWSALVGFGLDRSLNFCHIYSDKSSLINLHQHVHVKKRTTPEFEGSRRGMLTMGEWWNPVCKILHHV